MANKVTIFDVDNTLIDSKSKLERDVIETFARLGKRIGPRKARGEWYSLASHYGISKEDFDYEFSKRESWEDSIKKGVVTLFPETIPALETLKSEGYKILLLSKSIKEYTNQKIELLNLSEYVDDVEVVHPEEPNKIIGARNLIRRNNPEEIDHIYAIGDKEEDVNIIYPLRGYFEIGGTGLYLNGKNIPKYHPEIKKVNSLKGALKIINGD